MCFFKLIFKPTLEEYHLICEGELLQLKLTASLKVKTGIICALVQNKENSMKTKPS